MARLGAPVANSGNPDIQPIPAGHDAHLDQVRNATWFQQVFPGPPDFRLVEIDPLLAFQAHVDLERSAHHCNILPNPPSVADLLPLCLPHQSSTVPLQAAMSGNSVILKSRSLNLRLMAQGALGPNAAGVAWGAAPATVSIVRYNGRCYLSNGFHRCYGVRLAGGTHVPCLFRDVATPEEVGIRADGTTFGLTLLESPAAPTVGHLSQGRAHPVLLRATTRIIHVSWSEYAMPDE